MKISKQRKPAALTTAGKAGLRPAQGGRRCSRDAALLAASTAAMLAGTLEASAQEWPQRPIRIIVALGPGGGADIVSRILGPVDAGKTRTAGRHRKPPGGRRYDRQRSGRPRREGRLHARHDNCRAVVLRPPVMHKALRYDTLTAFDPISLVGHRKPVDRRHKAGLSRQGCKGTDRAREVGSRQIDVRPGQLRGCRSRLVGLLCHPLNLSHEDAARPWLISHTAESHGRACGCSGPRAV